MNDTGKTASLEEKTFKLTCQDLLSLLLNLSSSSSRAYEGSEVHFKRTMGRDKV
jgi:hypothetical protein